MEVNQTQSRHSSRDALREILLNMMVSNPKYSARAFARDLGVSSPFINMVLNGKKKLSLNRAVEITQIFKLSEEEKQNLLQATLQDSGVNLEVKTKFNRSCLQSLSEEQFKVIADWYHFAILDLTTTKKFQANSQWIARKLELRPLEVEVAIARLIKVGLLRENGNRLEKTNLQIDVPTQASAPAVREHHRQMMRRAEEHLKKIDQKSFESRMICSVTFAGDKNLIEAARQKVLDFQQELASFMSAGKSCEDVYQLNIQFFPHTKEEL